MFRLVRLTRRLVLFAVVIVLAAAGTCVAYAGRMLVDPQAIQTPQPADAIVVLSGGGNERWLEAYELWREKRAPRIVLSPGYDDLGTIELKRRGVRVPSEVETTHDILTNQLRVPADVLAVMPGPVGNTAAEAAATRDLARKHGWRRLIVVTSIAHTRRTGIAMRRVLEPAGIDVQIRATRFDGYEAWGWWRSRGSIRWVLAEWPKLVAYKLGVGE
jgi:uncharacterized SAM-binding protein YcdF (DUF218 family)